mgnify:CR=1 FL=1
MADVPVVDPLALLLLPAATRVVGPLSILFVVRKAAYVVIAIGIYEPAIAVHLVVVDLPFVNCPVIYNISTNTSDIVCIIQLAAEVWVHLALAVLKVVVDFWDSAVLLDVEEADGPEF